MEAVVSTLVGCILVFLTIIACCVFYRVRTMPQYSYDKVGYSQ